MTQKHFEPETATDLNEHFPEVMRVFVDSELDVEDIIVRVYGKQRNYYEGALIYFSPLIHK